VRLREVVIIGSQELHHLQMLVFVCLGKIVNRNRGRNGGVTEVRSPANVGLRMSW